MSITNLNKNIDGLIAPPMDVDVAVRRILAILNSMGGLSSDGRSVLNVDSGAISSTFRTIDNVTVVVAGTRVQLPNVVCKGVMLVAPGRNSGNVYIGGSGVTNGTGVQTGIVLSSLGMSSTVLNISNLNQIYVNADTAGDSIGIAIL